ncbi:MAG: hypothetical protein JNL01_15230 [Bdellovibrionales bacterium]|nr:hypothetical protein [Bdellovibrionales bacterium]
MSAEKPGLEPEIWKQLVKPKTGPIWSFYCAICEVPRKLKLDWNLNRPIHWVRIGLTTAVFTLATFHWFGWKGLVSFVPFWTLFEVSYRLRIRRHSRCPHCGFDPFLAMTNVPQAKAEVARFWAQKFEELGVEVPAQEPLPQPPSAEKPAQVTQT